MSKNVVILLLLGSALLAEQAPDMAQISEAFGHLIYRNFTLLDVPFDIAKIAQGIQDAAAGKKAEITEAACIEAIHAEQEKKLKFASQNNLKKAEAFLANNAENADIVSIAGGKVQYKILTQGNGATVKEHSSPLLRFSITSDGSEILPPNREETVSLDEAIDGLKAGLIGMKEGEKRLLYIHPNLAFGEKGLSTFYPNALITFEVEVLKAQ